MANRNAVVGLVTIFVQRSKPMIKSMTGFGKAECQVSNRRVSIEIRCLNSKQMDLSVRIPSIFRDKEMEIRTEVSRKLIRGKVDVFYTAEAVEGEALHTMNLPLIKKYYADIELLSKELQLEHVQDPLALLLHLPDAFKPGKEEVAEEDWRILDQCLLEALKSVETFRAHEGKSIEEDLLKRLALIKSYLIQIEPFETDRIQSIRQKMKKSLQEALQGSLPDENRFEQEMIFYLERLDISEEKSRLSQHCQHFIEAMDQDEPPGKKLGFISQEMGREINTLGSKANDGEIQRWVVLMKDELEKIKEQLFNVL